MSRHILIRYTKRAFVNSCLTGHLYFSSLSKFWNLQTGKSKITKTKLGEIKHSKLCQAMKFNQMLQQDFHEGVAASIPYEYLRPEIVSSFTGNSSYEVRLRIEAYGYCNLLCFFRVDVDEKSGVIHLPDVKMDMFGDRVIIINDEEEFLRRITVAVQSRGELFVAGDVAYHDVLYSKNGFPLRQGHSVTIISGSEEGKGSSKDGLFDIKAVCTDRTKIDSYGPLDKYSKFCEQREWRVCWLPKKRNFKDKVLPVGQLDDIIEVVPTMRVREFLLNRFPGCVPGNLPIGENKREGNCDYSELKQTIEAINGKCRVIMDFG